MPGKKLPAKDLAHFENQLRMMLGVLNGDIDGLQASTLWDENRPEMQGDEGKNYSIELSLELLQHDAKTMKEVLDALQRLEQGTYGRCQTCGQWLLKDRLRAMPHARNCIGCQRAVEAEQL